MRIEPSEAARIAIATCREFAFAEAGIAEVVPSRWGAELRSWLEAGKHGSMEYLARCVEERLDPQRVLPGAKSAVMVMDQYSDRDAAVRSETGDGVFGRIARYAQGRDYHVVMKNRLHSLADRLRERFSGGEFRAFVDTAPVLERELAARAGLGWIGKHTLLIHPKRGSYSLLGGILTTVEMEADEPEPDHCGTCTRCIDACPTDAITPYSVNASRCISYLTIERRKEIATGFHHSIGDWLFGCDICQDVCPHNSPRPGAAAPGINPAYSPIRGGFDVLAVLGWTEEDRRREFTSSAMKRATLSMMKRNALIVAANVAGDRPDVVARIKEVSGDGREPEVVRETARQVLAKVASKSPGNAPMRATEGRPGAV